MLKQSIRLVVMLAFLPLLFLWACQKEFNPETTSNGTLSSRDPKSLSASIKVWHGVRTQGVAPAPKGSALMLAPSTEPVRAFAGRYAIIQPEVMGGDVLGYYVSLNGAPEHFKVDYSKPRNLSGKLSPQKKGGTAFRTRGVDSTGNVDSSIVIVLPASIKVPDTFCVTYWAYDSQGNISPGVSTCIIVSSVGADASSGWIHGEWKMTASWDGSGNRDTIIYNRMMSDSDPYYCSYDSVTGQYTLGHGPAGTPVQGTDSILYRKANLAFAVNGAQLYEEEMEGKNLNLSSSTCNQLVYSSFTEKYKMTGGWSFNSSTKKLTIIFEIDEFGYSMVEAWEFNVIKETNTNFIIIDQSDPTDPYFIRLQKI